MGARRAPHSQGFKERLVFWSGGCTPPQPRECHLQGALRGAALATARAPEDGGLSVRHAWLVAEVCNLRVKIAS